MPSRRTEHDVTSLLIGTGNESKFRRYKRLVEGYPHRSLSVISVRDLGGPIPVPEDGATARENAAQKARAYADAYGLLTLAIDEALYIDGLPEHEQPGTYVRRQQGRTLTDDEVLAFFIDRVKRIPQQDRSVNWVFALAIADPTGRVVFDEIGVSGAIGVDPVLPLLPGYPLSSILIHVGSGKVHRDLTPEEELERLVDVRQCLFALLDSAIAT